MKKYIMILSAALLTVASYAQSGQTEKPSFRVPDPDRIESEITNPASRYYYPLLMSRYTAGDTTLDAADYYYLYYGYPFQAGYKPLLLSEYADSLSSAFTAKTSPTAETYRRVVQYSRNTLAQEPFNMRDLNALAFAYQMLEEPENADAALYKMEMIASTIRSSGDGLSEANPWHIIYHNHAEDLLNLLGAQYSRGIIISRTTEFIGVSNMPDKRHKGYYFDFSEIYKRKPEYLEGVKQKRKLEINPFYHPKSSIYPVPR